MMDCSSGASFEGFGTIQSSFDWLVATSYRIPVVHAHHIKLPGAACVPFPAYASFSTKTVNSKGPICCIWMLMHRIGEFVRQCFVLPSLKDPDQTPPLSRLEFTGFKEKKWEI